jgi:chromosome segregation ATPase
MRIGVSAILLTAFLEAGVVVASSQKTLDRKLLAQGTNSDRDSAASNSAKVNQIDREINELSTPMQQRTETIRSTQSEISNLQEQKTQAMDTSQKATIDKQISKLQSRLATLASSQKADMLRLQALINKRKQANELPPNLTNKTQNTQESIRNNQR